MKSGYSHQTFSRNLLGLIRDGYEKTNAVMIAASYARKSYFARYPKGALPEWLAYPKMARLAKFYDSSGRPLQHAIASNPRMETHPSQRALSQATRLYEGFTGKPPRKLHKIAVPALPETALAIGKVFGIMYSVDATGERFHHEFKSKAQPLLVVSSDGQQVYLIGGSFTFTKRGFVDN